MNVKILIGIIVILIVIGGVSLFVIVKSATPNTGNLQTMLQTYFSRPTPTPSVSKAVTQQVSNKKDLVTITTFGFLPAHLEVQSGETVTWVNSSGSDVIMYSDPNPTHTDYPSLNLGTLAAGSLHALEFTSAGTYSYYNGLNPSQHGTIIVK